MLCGKMKNKIRQFDTRSLRSQTYFFPYQTPNCRTDKKEAAAAGRREQQAAGTHFSPEKLSSFFFQATKPEDSFDINNSDKLP